MRNVYTFAGLTFALALAFSLTTAAQTQVRSPNNQPHQIRDRQTLPEICIGTGLVSV